MKSGNGAQHSLSSPKLNLHFTPEEGLTYSLLCLITVHKNVQNSTLNKSITKNLLVDN
jgi:hypothetical protein